MAIMIPETPRDFKPGSREDIMFAALKKLPDSYYVVHSYLITKIKRDNSVLDAEADFVVFNRSKGLLCLEAKATRVKYLNGVWCYGNEKPMGHGGPFRQAGDAMYDILTYMQENGMSDLIERCKFFHGVWFPLVSKEYILSLPLPQEAPPELILTKEALEDPEPWLERIFSYTERHKTESILSEAQAERIVNEVLCPKFEIVSSADFEAEVKKIVFRQLLREQASVLNFLEEQKTAVINGAAGTGKTLIALEKAKRHANRGEKVLFLCFNNRLKNHLADNNRHDNIDYYTIAGYACSICRTPTPDYDLMIKVLEEMWENNSFPYQHIVVDEGQDFGIEMGKETDVLETLKTIIEDTKEDGSFYVFYDKLQLVQARKMPKFLEDADCKLTLYRNCRNTENIAKTSLRPISERNPKLMENCIIGVPARMHFCEDYNGILNSIDTAIDSLHEDGIRNIVILTCKTESESCISEEIKEGYYPAGMEQILFTTCRKFKGLEADAVILVDVDEKTFLGEDRNGKNVLRYYVGTSRARLRLDIITSISQDGAMKVLESLGKTEKAKHPKRDLARALNAVFTIDED